MKKIKIYFFSGTGNTKKAAELFKNEFEAKGVVTKITEIKKDVCDFDTEDCDAVGIFYPVHAFNAPYVVLDFARKLQKTHDKPLFIVKTSGEPVRLNNISSLKLISVLKKRGYDFFAEYHYVMPYNMIFRHGDKAAFRMWDTMKKLVPVDASEVLEKTPRKPRKIPFGGVIALLFRIEHPAMRVNGRFFKVDYEKCVGCGKCVRNCPMNNIVYENGKFRFKGDCACCVACSFNCPENAISIALLNGWKVNGPYNFDNPCGEDDGSHSRYCKKAYDRYFREAEIKTALQKLDN